MFQLDQFINTVENADLAAFNFKYSIEYCLQRVDQYEQLKYIRKMISKSIFGRKGENFWKIWKFYFLTHLLSKTHHYLIE